MKLTELSQPDKPTEGTFVGVRLTKESARALSNWFKENDILDPLGPSDLHITLIYSDKEKFDPELESYDPPLRLDPTTFEPRLIGPEWSTLVLKFEDPKLEERHEALKKAHGIEWPYSRYLPHITMTYTPVKEIPELSPIDFPLELEEEYARDTDPEMFEAEMFAEATSLKIPSPYQSGAMATVWAVYGWQELASLVQRFNEVRFIWCADRAYVWSARDLVLHHDVLAFIEEAGVTNILDKGIASKYDEPESMEWEGNPSYERDGINFWFADCDSRDPNPIQCLPTSSALWVRFFSSTLARVESAGLHEENELLSTNRMIDSARSSKCHVIAHITPIEFLKMTTPNSNLSFDEIYGARAKQLAQYNHWARIGDDPEYAKRTNAGKSDKDFEYGISVHPFITVALNPDGSGTIAGHEGRHRAYAVMKQGGETMPVAICLQPYDGQKFDLDIPAYEYPIYYLSAKHLPLIVHGQYENGYEARTDKWKVANPKLQNR